MAGRGSLGSHRAGEGARNRSLCCVNAQTAKVTHELQHKNSQSEMDNRGWELVLFYEQRRARDPTAPLAMAGCSFPGGGTFRAHLPCLMQGLARLLDFEQATTTLPRSCPRLHLGLPITLTAVAAVCATRALALCTRIFACSPGQHRFTLTWGLVVMFVPSCLDVSAIVQRRLRQWSHIVKRILAVHNHASLVIGHLLTEGGSPNLLSLRL